MILRLLGEELEAASWLIEAGSRMEPVELYNEEQQPRSHKELYKLCGIYRVYYVPYVPYIPHVAKGFLRRIDVYLRRTIVPTRQFSLYSDSQNIIRVNLLGNHSTSCTGYQTILYLYTQPINRTHRSISYQVPLQVSYNSRLQERGGNIRDIIAVTLGYPQDKPRTPLGRPSVTYQRHVPVVYSLYNP